MKHLGDTTAATVRLTRGRAWTATLAWVCAVTGLGSGCGRSDIMVVELRERAVCSGVFQVTVFPTKTTDLWPGDELQFQPGGGCPDYTATDAGTGFLDRRTLIYTVGYDAVPGTDTVSFSDARGSRVQFTVSFRGFLTAPPLLSDVTATPGIFLHDMVENDAALVAIGARYASYRPEYVAGAIYRSMDQGVTWTNVDTFRANPGKSTYGLALDAHANNVVALFEGATANASSLYVRLSRDAGLTWSPLLVLAEEGYGLGATDVKFVNDDVFVIGAYRNSLSTDYREGLLYRCQISTQSCTLAEVFPSVASYGNEPQALAATADGTIYAAIRERDTEVTTLRRSTDGGQSYTTLRSRAAGGDVYGALAASADGNVIVWSGAWVESPWIEYTFDGGTTWLTDQTGAAFLWRYQSIAILPNLDLLASGYCFSSCGEGTRWVANKRLYASGTWINTTPAVAGENGRQLLVTRNEQVLAYSSGSIKRSADFGVSYTDLALISSPEIFLGRKVTSLLRTPEAKLYRTDVSLTDTNGQGAGRVLSSVDAGQTWVDEDAPGNDTTLNSMTYVPDTGTLMSAGATGYQWLVRRQANGTGPWTSIISTSPYAANGGIATAMATAANREIFVVGNGFINNGLHWLALRSNDEGATFVEVDDYTDISGYAASALAVAAYGNDIVVAGTATDTAGVEHWRVRRFDGDAWSVMDDFVLPGMGRNTPAAALQVGTELYVVGSAYESDAHRADAVWLTRRFALGQWHTLDQFQVGAAQAAGATALTVLTDGSVVVAGYAVDDDGIQKAALRRYHEGDWRTLDLYAPWGDASYTAVAECVTNRPCAAGLGYQVDADAAATLFRMLSEAQP